jgi:hypothetical protein
MNDRTMHHVGIKMPIAGAWVYSIKEDREAWREGVARLLARV